MRSPSSQVDVIRERLRCEAGTLFGHGSRSVALVYPSPYALGMSSLGFQHVYRLFNSLPDTSATRAFVPDEGQSFAGPLLAYESGRPVADHGVIAFSIAYELELCGVFAALDLAGVPVLASERTARHPWVIAGGPLTFVNAAPLASFIDVVVMGEAEESVGPLIDSLFSGTSREQALATLASLPGFYVPSVHGDTVPAVARCADAYLPASSVITTKHATWPEMFLVETERGCSRSCAFCAMQRRVSGGMRVVPEERILAAVPATTQRIGLVGAAVSDHPGIERIVEALVGDGRQVSLSSLRAERLSESFVRTLVKGGLQTLTVAADGTSERLRESLDKRVRTEHLLNAARLAGELGIRQLKNYAMVGVPGETDADIDEFAACVQQQAVLAGGRTKVVVGVSTFVAKLHTPLAEAPFVGARIAAARIERLRRALGARADVRASSTRWAWAEWLLATGGREHGERALQAYRQGGSFAAWKKAFRDIASPDGAKLKILNSEL